METVHNTDSGRNVFVEVDHDAGTKTTTGGTTTTATTPKSTIWWKRLFRGSPEQRSALSLATATTALIPTRSLSYRDGSVLSSDDDDDDNEIEEVEIEVDEKRGIIVVHDALQQEDVIAPLPTFGFEQPPDNDTMTIETKQCIHPSYPAYPEASSTLPVHKLPTVLSSTNLQMLKEAQQAQGVGDYCRCLELYQNLLTDIRKDSYQSKQGDLIQLANLCYACTRLATQIQEPDHALWFAEQELWYTLQLSQGRATLAVSKCQHELGRIARTGLGESERALYYYKQALRTERTVYQRKMSERACPASIVEVRQHIQETKECIGRILFELGKIPEAIGML